MFILRKFQHITRWFGVSESGGTSTARDHLWGVRPMVTLTSGVTIKDGGGTSDNPYRLNEINYE